MKARIIETVACTNCGQHKKYPEEFITSYNKNEFSSVCRDCRNLKRKLSRLKQMGIPATKKGWGDKKNTFNRDLFRDMKKKEVK